MSLLASMTRDAALKKIATNLSSSGLADARSEARHLMQGVLEISAADLIARGDLPLGPAADTLTAATKQRMQRVPLARILGRKEFFGRHFLLSKETLVPRPETETLVEAALDHLPHVGQEQTPLRILDLGTGTGAILLTLLAEVPQALGWGTDISLNALTTAQSNADRLNLLDRCTFLQSDWFSGLSGRFDIIVSNPPYIESHVIPALEPEVAIHDPLLALDGGADGLAPYRILAQHAAGFLAPKGVILVEFGAGQASEIHAIFSRHGFGCRECRKDLIGLERILVFDSQC